MSNDLLTQVQQNTENQTLGDLPCKMPSISAIKQRYVLRWREQMSDRQVAANLRASAAQYFEKAAELDHKAEPPVHRHIQGGTDR